MADQANEFVTVFRSAGDPAEADAIAELLAEAGLSPRILGDDKSGVIEGTVEVQVPASEGSHAEQLIAESQEPLDESEQIDVSHEMDLVTIFSSLNLDAESEAIAVRGVLDANGIPSVTAANIPYPNLPTEVRVPKEHAERAQEALKEARAAGPLAAEEAEEAEESSEGLV